MKVNVKEHGLNLLLKMTVHNKYLMVAALKLGIWVNAHFRPFMYLSIFRLIRFITNRKYASFCMY